MKIHASLSSPSLCVFVCVHVPAYQWQGGEVCACACVWVKVRVRESKREEKHDLHLAKLIVWAWNCLTSPQSSIAQNHTIGCFQLQPDNSTGMTQGEGEGERDWEGKTRECGGHGWEAHTLNQKKKREKMQIDQERQRMAERERPWYN